MLSAGHLVVVIISPVVRPPVPFPGVVVLVVGVVTPSV